MLRSFLRLVACCTTYQTTYSPIQSSLPAAEPPGVNFPKHPAKPHLSRPSSPMKSVSKELARNERALRGTAGREFEPGIGKHSIMGNYMREQKLSVLKVNAVGAVAFMAIGWLFWSAGGVSIAQTQTNQQPPTSASAQPPPAALPPGVDDVVKLAHSGLGDDVILAKIRNDGASYSLTSDQIIYLSHAGVSQNVLAALLQSKSSSTTATAVNPESRTTVPPAAVAEPPPLDAVNPAINTPAAAQPRAATAPAPFQPQDPGAPSAYAPTAAPPSLDAPAAATAQPTHNWTAPSPAGQPTVPTPPYAPSSRPNPTRPPPRRKCTPPRHHRRPMPRRPKPTPPQPHRHPPRLVPSLRPPRPVLPLFSPNSPPTATGWRRPGMALVGSPAFPSVGALIVMGDTGFIPIMVGTGSPTIPGGHRLSLWPVDLQR